MHTIAILLLAVATCAAQPQPTTTSTDAAPSGAANLIITYLANEGVFLEFDGQGVLIDALFRDGVAGYDRLPADERERIETAQPPYDKVRAVLVTHRHDDHFDAASVLRHLQHNPNARLISSTQVTQLVIALPACNEAIRDRIVAADPVDTDMVIVESAGPKIAVLLLSHGERMADVTNLGFIVHLGSRRVLHIGDAAHESKTTRPLNKHAQGVDVACVPYWLLLEPWTRSFYERKLAPSHLIAFHIEPAKAQQIADRLSASVPEAVAWTKRLTKTAY